ncbi:MAG: hypothetical protein DRJ37_02275 [Thermoprotei archaeon]|nr:MAG: hypothetical protein DRJ37_02275 [Thermoprotei archaeon]
MVKVYLFTDNNEDSLEAEKLLKDVGVEFKKIDVSKNGLKGWLLVEFGTMNTPIMTTPNAVIVGLENIQKYVRTAWKKLL